MDLGFLSVVALAWAHACSDTTLGEPLDKTTIEPCIARPGQEQSTKTSVLLLLLFLLMRYPAAED